MGDAPIRIEVVRSGGFAGVTLRGSLDTAALPADEARAVAEVVAGLDFDELARRAAQPAGGADRFQYDLTVEQGPVRHQVSLPESAVPDELKPLLARLMADATPAE